MAKVILKIEGMHCTACAMNIDFDLEDLDGVKSAKTNYAKSLTEIEYNDDQINTDKIVEIIKKAGYLAKLT